MKIDNTLSREQCIALYFICGSGSITYTFSWIIRLTGISYGALIIVGLLLMILLSKSIIKYNLYGNKTIFDMIEKHFNKIVSKVFLIIYILLNFLIAIMTLIFFVNIISIYLLPNTPIWIISLFCTFISTIFVSSGVKNFAKIFEILTVVSLLNFLIAYSLAPFSGFRIEYIFPIFENNFYELFKGFIFILGGVSDFLLLSMIIMGDLPTKKKSQKWAEQGILLFVGIVSIGTILYVGIIGRFLLQIMPHSGLSVVRFIHIGEFVRGLEIFVLTTYQFVTIGKITLFLYCIKEASIKLFNINKSTTYIYIASLILFIGTLMLYSFNKVYWLSIIVGTYVVVPFGLIIIGLAKFIKYNKKFKKRRIS